MPSEITVLDSDTGETTELFGVTAREWIANDPGRYSIVDDSAEVAASKGPGLRIVSYTVRDSRSRSG
jgi:hypothetical protein